MPAHLLDPLRGLQCAGVSEALLPGLEKSGPKLHPEHVHVTIRRESTGNKNVSLVRGRPNTNLKFGCQHPTAISESLVPAMDLSLMLALPTMM